MVANCETFGVKGYGPVCYRWRNSTLPCPFRPRHTHRSAGMRLASEQFQTNASTATSVCMSRFTSDMLLASGCTPLCTACKHVSLKDGDLENLQSNSSPRLVIRQRNFFSKSLCKSTSFTHQRGLKHLSSDIKAVMGRCTCFTSHQKP